MVKAGDWVRLREVPSWVPELDLPDVQEIYRVAVGKVLQVKDIDETGKLTLEIWPPENPCGEQVDILYVDPKYVELVTTKEPFEEGW